MFIRELLRRIRRFAIVTQRLVRDRMAGQNHSVFKGSGIVFSEVRSTCRATTSGSSMGRVRAHDGPYVKLFVEGAR